MSSIENERVYDGWDMESLLGDSQSVVFDDNSGWHKDEFAVVMLGSHEEIYRHRHRHSRRYRSLATVKGVDEPSTKARRDSQLRDSIPLGDPPITLRLDDRVAKDEVLAPFGGSIPTAAIGTEVNLKASKKLRKRSHPSFAMVIAKDIEKDDDTRIEDIHMDGFITSLNWATNENPDGVPLVHDVIDQGNCGSCWAYAATGSLETSVARRVAQAAYERGFSLEETQDVQLEIFNQTRLSIQELLDCDRVVDQSCVGGNPLLAFFYIHRNGLTTWNAYPYDGQAAASCRRPSMTPPHAAVDAWGILPQNREDLIQIALRYIGPVAAAINGADPSFMAYQGGIFDNPFCRHEPNHAVLITGYGEDIDPATNTNVRYWIARNSWGRKWGEDGYIRIRRGAGNEKTPGVCGVARSASVALGGQLLGSSRWASLPDAYFHDESWNELDTDLHLFCDAITPPDSLVRFRCRRLVDYFNYHRAAALASLSLLVILLLAWPLTYSCRRRAEAVRFRKRFTRWQEDQRGKGQQCVEVGSGARSIVPNIMSDPDVPSRILEDDVENENTPLLGPIDTNGDGRRSTPMAVFRDSDRLRTASTADRARNSEGTHQSSHLSVLNPSFGCTFDSHPASPIAGRILNDAFEEDDGEVPVRPDTDSGVDTKVQALPSSPRPAVSTIRLGGTANASRKGLESARSTVDPDRYESTVNRVGHGKNLPPLGAKKSRLPGEGNPTGSVQSSRPTSPMSSSSTMQSGDEIDPWFERPTAGMLAHTPTVGDGGGPRYWFHEDKDQMSNPLGLSEIQSPVAKLIPVGVSIPVVSIVPGRGRMLTSDETLSISSVEEGDDSLVSLKDKRYVDKNNDDEGCDDDKEEDKDKDTMNGVGDSTPSPVNTYGGLALYKSLPEDSSLLVGSTIVPLQPPSASILLAVNGRSSIAVKRKEEMMTK